MDYNNILCKQLIYTGKPPEAVNIYRENNITIKRNNISYRISISTFFTYKTIKIETELDIPFKSLRSLLFEFIRFENLFDGVFFAPTSIVANSVEYIDEISQNIIPYYTSKETRYTCFNLKMNDIDYMRYFNKWTEYKEKLKIIHQVYLYNAFVKGNPVDIRISLLLEVFEPLSKILKKEGKITLVSPRTPPKKCPKCKAIVAKGKPAKITYQNRLVCRPIENYNIDG